mgnify:CR=1 FL=1
MDNKNDWDELEKWNTQRIIDEKEKSKFYNEEFRKNKKIENITKGLKITGIIIRVLVHIILLIAIIIGISILAARVASKL